MRVAGLIDTRFDSSACQSGQQLSSLMRAAAAAGRSWTLTTQAGMSAQHHFRPVMVKVGVHQCLVWRQATSNSIPGISAVVEQPLLLPLGPSDTSASSVQDECQLSCVKPELHYTHLRGAAFHTRRLPALVLHHACWHLLQLHSPHQRHVHQLPTAACTGLRDDRSMQAWPSRCVSSSNASIHIQSLLHIGPAASPAEWN
jgi:hypothetical protein